MTSKIYQRRYLRAPLKEEMIYLSGDKVFKTKILNISEGGVLIDELPSFPATYDVPLLTMIPVLPLFNSFELIKMQSYNRHHLQKISVRATARMVRKEQLSQNFKGELNYRYGLEFVKFQDQGRSVVEGYVNSYASNLVHLQMLLDSYSTDEDARKRCLLIAELLGYEELDKISHLRSKVIHDYKSLQWL